MDKFPASYIETALWSSTGDDDQPLDRDYGVEDLAPETLEKMIIDCACFQAQAEDFLRTATCSRSGYGCDDEEMSAHDFWLTRNRHGAGFWDGDWSEPEAAELTKIAHSFGECDLYVGDDGKIYCS